MKRLRIAPNEGQSVSYDGLAFKWVVHESGHIVIQHASGHGCCLVIDVPTDSGPWDAELLVRLAFAEDWEPTQDGPNHWFRYEANGSSPALVRISSRDELL